MCVLCFTWLKDKLPNRDNKVEVKWKKVMQSLTLVMEVDMLSPQLGSSWHPDSETQRSEPPNPPADREGRMKGKKKTDRGV